MLLDIVPLAIISQFIVVAKMKSYLFDVFLVSCKHSIKSILMYGLASSMITFFDLYKTGKQRRCELWTLGRII